MYHEKDGRKERKRKKIEEIMNELKDDQEMKTSLK